MAPARSEVRAALPDRHTYITVVPRLIGISRVDGRRFSACLLGHRQLSRCPNPFLPYTNRSCVLPYVWLTAFTKPIPTFETALFAMT